VLEQSARADLILTLPEAEVAAEMERSNQT
jgi:hypothetical protein